MKSAVVYKTFLTMSIKLKIQNVSCIENIYEALNTRTVVIGFLKNVHNASNESRSVVTLLQFQS